jgi:GNAT superfamily N-acetyltransferase
VTNGEAPRRIERIYRDPLDEIWLAAARALGVRVVRSDEVYASYDGRGTLALSTPAHMDADDSLAQLIFHELCHALVSGDDALAREDWGLCNLDARDLTAEHACHRVQAALSGEHGLRGLFAVTTEHRPYWDALGADPLADGEGGGGDEGDEQAVRLAREAYARARREPFAAVLQDALRRTARVMEAVGGVAEEGSLWAESRTRTSTSTSTSTNTRTRTRTTTTTSAERVRKARREDYPRVRALFDGLDVLHREALPWLFQRSDQELRPDELLERLTGDVGALLVAEGEGPEILGFAILLLQQAPAQRIFVPGKHVLLDNLVVDPAARRQGVGTALLHEAEAWARAHGAARVELNVYDFNEPALRFYASAGYTVLGHRLKRTL